MSLPTFVAVRYLRPRRGRGLVSVITAIAILSFAAGVGALILALAITNGFRQALQNELVGATTELNLLHREPTGILHYHALMRRLAHLPHVRALAPAVYTEVYLSNGARGAETTVKGVIPRQELRVSRMLTHVVAGSWQPLQAHPAAPNLVLGQGLAQMLGVGVGGSVQMYVPNAVLTPLGYTGRTLAFRVVGIFHSGFSDFDGQWAYTGFQAAQQLHPGGDYASVIEFGLDNIYEAQAVARAAMRVAGPQFAATTWMAQNHAIFQALQTERLGTLLIIGLIVFIAGLNVLILLSMLVIEKRREIAVLLSMGARRRQIRRIFIYQGVVIAAVGTAIGLAVSFAFAGAANAYHWIPLSGAVYAINYVPFQARWSDGALVAVIALLVSLVATLYPAHRAVQIRPAETLRYE